MRSITKLRVGRVCCDVLSVNEFDWVDAAGFVHGEVRLPARVCGWKARGGAVADFEWKGDTVHRWRSLPC